MTEERKKYLAGISKEERIVRRVIDEQKSILRTCKEELNDNYLTFSDLDYLYPMINSYKESIKALKKQLPAPKEKFLHYINYCPNCLEDVVNTARYCSNCGYQLMKFVCPKCKCNAELNYDYCYHCGQKLR